MAKPFVAPAEAARHNVVIRMMKETREAASHHGGAEPAAGGGAHPGATSGRDSDLALLLGSVPGCALVMLDPEGVVRIWSAGAAQLFGYAADRIVGQPASVLYLPEDQARPDAERRTALETGRFEGEAWRVRAEGERFWASVVVAPLRTAAGDLRGFGMTVRDLTDRGRTDDYRRMVESVADYAIFLLDPQGRIRSWNTGAQRIKGYAPEEIIGRHFSAFYTEEDRSTGHPARELTIAAATGRYEEEGWRVRSDGGRFWANVVITRLLDEEGRIVGYSKVTRDLTERRRAEEALRESEERFRLLIDGVRDYAIILLDPKGHVVSWNAGAERIKGWTAREIIGRHFSVFYTPEDVKSGKAERELDTATREGRFEDHGWRVRKDGTRFWANVVVTLLRGEDGEVRGFSKITRDITDRMHVEEELRRARTDLERRVDERTRDLTAAYRELEAFSYSISHDLRAPLRSMDGFSNAILKIYGDKLDERGRDYLTRIRDSAVRMGQLIEGMLNLARLGRSEMKCERVDVAEVARAIIAELRGAEPERDVEFIAPPSLPARVDPTMLRVVLENLLGNAWKYTSRQPKARIELSRAVKGDQDVFLVRDDGVGFDMAFAGKLFGAFQRLHGVKEFAGTGIGLATVKRIVARHGGDVWGEGEAGRGATFYFSLPKGD
jgi:PAS domain S-box-containing protein